MRARRVGWGDVEIVGWLVSSDPRDVALSASRFGVASKTVGDDTSTRAHGVVARSKSTPVPVGTKAKSCRAKARQVVGRRSGSLARACSKTGSRPAGRP
jgi:hypothetical protein